MARLISSAIMSLDGYVGRTRKAHWSRRDGRADAAAGEAAAGTAAAASTAPAARVIEARKLDLICPI
jgi:hypothetical protein